MLRGYVLLFPNPEEILQVYRHTHLLCSQHSTSSYNCNAFFCSEALISRYIDRALIRSSIDSSRTYARRSLMPLAYSVWVHD